MRQINGNGRTRRDREEEDENRKICLSLGGVVLALFMRLPLQKFKRCNKKELEEVCMHVDSQPLQKGKRRKFLKRRNDESGCHCTRPKANLMMNKAITHKLR